MGEQWPGNLDTKFWSSSAIVLQDNPEKVMGSFWALSVSLGLEGV